MARYRLRTMVLARMFSEVAVLLGMMALPICLVCAGTFSSFKPPVQGTLIALAVIAVAILPWFGFITWLVTTNEDGICAHALFKKQFVKWDQIKSLTRRASWNWLRFVVSYEGGELTFPILLNQCDLLVREIRGHTPQGAGGGVGGAAANIHRSFAYDPVVMSLQVGKSIAAILFVTLFWFFFSAKSHHFRPGSNDAISLLIFCALASLLFLWRFVAVMLMPKSVEVTKPELVVRNLFQEKHIPWAQVLSVGVPLPLLPEGFTIKTRQGTILIGSGMEAGDELQEIVVGEIALRKQLQAGAPTPAASNIDFAEIEQRINEQREYTKQVLQTLAEHGVDVEAEREIAYIFATPTLAAAQALAGFLTVQGCRTEILEGQQPPETQSESFAVRAAALQSPAAAGSDSNCAVLLGLADQHGCRYEGWSTDFETANSPPNVDRAENSPSGEEENMPNVDTAENAHKLATENAEHLEDRSQS